MYLFIYLRAELDNSQLQVNTNTNTNSSNMTNIWSKQIDQLKILKFNREHLKISVDLQTAFSSENTSKWRAVVVGATERGKITYVPSRNTNADYFEGRGATFTTIIN
jgi:hypothetical protein